MYFLGFAGHGEERVFAEEIKLAATQSWATTYGSAPRSVLLLNDRRDLTTYPLRVRNPPCATRSTRSAA